MANVIVKPKKVLEQGFACDVCKKRVEATAMYVTNCDHCKQKYVAETAA